MSKSIGFDFGSSCIAYCDGDKKDIMMMPSAVAFNRKTKQVLAAGADARKMVGRNPNFIEIVKPIKGGTISDTNSVDILISEILQRFDADSVFKKTEFFATIPFGISKSDENAFDTAFLQSRRATLDYVYTPIAIALGAGMPLDISTGRMIVDIGAGHADATIISHGGIVTSSSTKTAGDAITAAVAEYIAEAHGIEVGELTAEAIKVKLGTLDPTKPSRSIKICGKVRPDKNPKFANQITASSVITSHELIPIIAPFADKIVETITVLLEKTPPEISSDISDFGILLSGGSAMLDGMPRYLQQAVGVKISTTKAPAQDAARGLWRVIRGGRAYAKFTKI